MQTIKEIEKRIQMNQLSIDGENRIADQDRDRVAAYSNNGDDLQAQRRGDAAVAHEQEAIRLQNEINELTNEKQRLEQQVNELNRQKQTVMQEKEAELQRIDDEIRRITGTF